MFDWNNAQYLRVEKEAEMKKMNVRWTWCPKCGRWRDMLIIGRKMYRPHGNLVWEVDLVCSDCGFRMWVPCEPPNRGKKDEKNKPA